MKEQKIIETINKVESLGRLVQHLLQENEYIKTMLMGDHAVLQKMPEFDNIIEEMKKEEASKADKAEGNRENKFELPSEEDREGESLLDMSEPKN